MSCSRTQHGGGRYRTPDLSLWSPTLYHWATALPINGMCWYTNRIQGSCDVSAIAYNLTLFYSFKNGLCHLIQRLWNSFNINMIIQIINWKICLFLLNVAFNNCSVISRQCLVATGSNAHFFSTASLKYHGQDTWHDTRSSHIILIVGRPAYLYPVNLSAKRVPF